MCAHSRISSTGSTCFYLSSPPPQKYSASHSPQIISITLAIPSHSEGRIAIVTDVGCGMRWTRQRLAREGSQGGFFEIRERHLKHADERCCQRTAKSCGSDAPTLASSFVETHPARPIRPTPSGLAAAEIPLYMTTVVIFEGAYYARDSAS